jgi:hypothetical protein
MFGAATVVITTSGTGGLQLPAGAGVLTEEGPEGQDAETQHSRTHCQLRRTSGN